MNLSYRDAVVRDYCCSLLSDMSNAPFSSEELVTIRSLLADLRSAPRLSDAPINFNLRNNQKNQLILTIYFEKIEITCSIISTYPDPKPSQISRILILEIIRRDLQLPNEQVHIA